MKVDVLTEVVIARRRAVVADFAANPGNAPDWYVNIKSIEWESKPGVRVGARAAFVAQFLGQRMACTYEIVEFVANERLVMRTTEGTFPMETTYTWESTAQDGTLMTLRNRSEPQGFSRLMAPMSSAAIPPEQGGAASRGPVLRCAALTVSLLALRSSAKAEVRCAYRQPTCASIVRTS